MFCNYTDVIHYVLTGKQAILGIEGESYLKYLVLLLGTGTSSQTTGTTLGILFTLL